jgi:hypothetical protein
MFSVRKGVKADCTGEENGSIVSSLIIRKGTYESSGERDESLEERVESRSDIFESPLSLQSTTVEANVPVRQLIDEVEHLGDDGVKAVGYERESMVSSEGGGQPGQHNSPSISSLTS